MAIVKCKCCKKNTLAINGIKTVLKQLMGKDGELGVLRVQTGMQAAEGVLMAMDFTELQTRMSKMEKKHPPFSYKQFRNGLLITWGIVITIIAGGLYG